MKRYNGVAGLKGIAILLIILMHVAVNENCDFNSFINKDTFLKLGFMVQLFFMLSAFGMCCGYYEKIKNNEISLNLFYSKRYKKILPFFGIIVLVEVVFSGITKRVLTEAFLDMTLVFGFLPKGNIEVVGVGWTLGTIFVFYILFPFFVFLIWNKRRAWITFIICLIIRFACGTYFINGDSTVMVNILLWCTQFVMGGLIYLYKDTLTDKFRNKKIIVITMLLALIGAMIGNFIYTKNDVIEEMLVFVFFIIVIIYAISYKSFLLENRVIQIIGKYCLEIYLSHMMIFRVVEKIPFQSVIGNQIISLVVTYVVTIIGTLIFSIIANKTIDRIGKNINERINA